MRRGQYETALEAEHLMIEVEEHKTRIEDLENAIQLAIEAGNECGMDRVKHTDIPHDWVVILAKAIGRDLKPDGYDVDESERNDD